MTDMYAAFMVEISPELWMEINNKIKSLRNRPSSEAIKNKAIVKMNEVEAAYMEYVRQQGIIVDPSSLANHVVRQTLGTLEMKLKFDKSEEAAAEALLYVAEVDKYALEKYKHAYDCNAQLLYFITSIAGLDYDSL